MFERYTEKARRAIFVAREEASQFGMHSIETEHLLLGLLRADPALSLRFLPSQAESIRKQIEESSVRGEKFSTAIDIPLSSECKHVMDHAAKEAERLGQKDIGTAHLLAGLICEEQCFAARLLRERGLSSSMIREGLQQSLRETEQRAASSDDRARGFFVGEDLAATYLEVSCRKLDVIVDQVKTCVGKLTDAQVWERHGAHENAVGNLLLHLAGNARQWIISGVGGVEDTRARAKEFSANGSASGAELLKHFTDTMAEVRGVIASVTAERLTEIVHPQGKSVTVLEAILVVVTHVHQHVGQIILLTKQMTGKDLDLTIPRPR